MTGFTNSSDFPTQNPYDGNYNGGSFDVFVAKLAAAGNSLVYSTFLGGSAYDVSAYEIAVDGSGSAYLTGRTLSSDFPTMNPFDASYNGGVTYGDAFVSKLSAAGNILVYSTYLGGGADDIGVGIAVDALGSAYVTGRTESSGFPTQNPYDDSHNGGASDVFVTKLSAAGNTLAYSTFLGGSGYDNGLVIAVDASGSAYVTGVTSSSDFPTQGPYDDSYNGGSYDVFVTELSTAGNTLAYSTFLGGSSTEYSTGIAVDALGSAYVLGITLSSDFPMQNPYDGSLSGNEDAFVTKLSVAGNTLVYSTFLGGSADDEGRNSGIAVDGRGSAYVMGYTTSSDFPTKNPYDGSYNGNGDIFVARLSAAGNALVYGTFLGGSGLDGGQGIAVDGSGSAYVTGNTQSSDFPAHKAYDATYNGAEDVFVVKVRIHTVAVTAHSPVDLTVIDPDGDSIGQGFNTIGAAADYDSTHDYGVGPNGVPGELDDRITIDDVKPGRYLVVVTPNPGVIGGNYYCNIRVDGTEGSYIKAASSTDSTADPSKDPYSNPVPTAEDPDRIGFTPTLQRRGDLNDDRVYDVLDVVGIVGIAFRAGTLPDPASVADVNCDGQASDVLDVVREVEVVFRAGNEPCL